MIMKAMRDGAKSGISKFLLFSLMAMAVFGLVLVDISSYFQGNIGSSTVAKIGNQKLSALEFDRDVRRVLERQGLDAPTAYQLGMINQILNAQISDHLMSRANYDAGLLVSDDIVAEQIRRLVAPYVSADLPAREALKRLLANQGMSEAQFVEGLRAELGKTIIRNALQLSSLYATDQEARDLNLYQGETRTVKSIYFPYSAIKDIGEAPEETLQSYYNAGKERYAISETRSFTVAILSPSELQKNITPSEDEIKALYEEEKLRFTAPERRTIEQVLFTDEEGAQAVVDKVKNKMPLKEAAKGSYIATGTFEQKDFATKIPEKIAAQTFNAQKGDVIGPVQTALGWHVLVLKDILQPVVKPYAEVKEELRLDLLQAEMSDKLISLSGDIDDQLAGGSTLEDVAKSMNLTLKSYGPLRQDATAVTEKDFGKDQGAIIKTAFEIEEGESAPVIELSDGRYAVVRTDEITEKSYKKFEDVKADLKSIWVNERQQTLNKEKADAALKELQEEKKTLEQIAAENGLGVKSYNLKRGDDVQAPFTPPAKANFFNIEKGALAVTSAKDGLIIGQVVSINMPDAGKIPAEKIAAAKEGLAQASANDTMNDYLTYLNRKYKVKINQPLLEKTYGTVEEIN